MTHWTAGCARGQSAALASLPTAAAQIWQFVSVHSPRASCAVRQSADMEDTHALSQVVSLQAHRAMQSMNATQGPE